MSYINWGLGQGNNALAAFGQGMQLGTFARQAQEQREARKAEAEGKNALAAYAGGDQAQMGAAMQYDPRAVLAIRGQVQGQEQAAAEQRRADLPTLTRLLEHASQGPEQWQQAIGVAQQYGIDTSSIPQQFDPEWAASQAQTLKLMQTPEAQEALSTAGKQAVDMGFQPGTPEFQAKVTEIWQQNGAIPYTDANGATRLYMPGRQQQGPEAGSVVGNFRFRGGDPNDRSNWEPVSQGGPTASPSGGFR